MFNNRIGNIKFLVATDAVRSFDINSFLIGWNGLESKYLKSDILFD